MQKRRTLGIVFFIIGLILLVAVPVLYGYEQILIETLPEVSEEGIQIQSPIYSETEMFPYRYLVVPLILGSVVLLVLGFVFIRLYSPLGFEGFDKHHSTR